MAHEDSATTAARPRRWWVWALGLVLVAAATVGGLARASKSQQSPSAPAVHIGSLAKLPDADFMRFLPERDDFPSGARGFLALTAGDLREHPEKPLPTDPPRCDPTFPLRGPGVLGEMKIESVASSAAASPGYTVAVARENPDQDFVASMGSWLDECPEASLPTVSNGRETRHREMIMEKLPDPSVGADRAISYVITVTDTSDKGPEDALYAPQTHIMTLAVVRGVALYCLARDTNPEFDSAQRQELLEKLVHRIRTY